MGSRELIGTKMEIDQADVDHDQHHHRPLDEVDHGDDHEEKLDLSLLEKLEMEGYVMKKVYGRLEEVLECSHCHHFFRGFNWYQCKSKGCKYILHPTCAKSLANISSFMHPYLGHDLEWIDTGCITTSCAVCNVHGRNKMYGCKVCDFYIHPTCSLWPKSLFFHELHPKSHPLQLQVLFPMVSFDPSPPPSPPPPPPLAKPPIQPYPPPTPPPLPPPPSKWHLLQYKASTTSSPSPPESEPLQLQVPLKVFMPPPPPPPLKITKLKIPKMHPIEFNYRYPPPPPPKPEASAPPKEALVCSPPTHPFTCHACKETSDGLIFYHCGSCNESYHPVCLLRFSLAYKNSHTDFNKELMEQ